MKTKHFVSFLFTALIAIIISCNSPEVKSIPATEEVAEKAASKEILAENKVAVEMEVEGMVCAMGCAKFIEDKVADMDGIASSTVSFEEGKAYFEFDKTELTDKEIELFINDIHDGQYKAKIIVEEDSEAIDEEDSSEEKSLTSVVEQFNFSFPELLTYFMKRL